MRRALVRAVWLAAVCGSGVRADAAVAAAPVPLLQRAAAAPQADTAVLTLGDVYRLARAGSPQLRVAQARATALRARRTPASTLPDPVIQLGVMNLALPELRAAMPASMAPSIQLMQMVPVPGRLRLAGRIAGHEADAAGADADEAWWRLREVVAAAYYDVQRADAQLGVMRETLRLVEDLEHTARAMYGAGEAAQADVLRASVEAARMHAEIRRMEAMRAAAAARLNGLLARPASMPVGATALPPLPAALPPADALEAAAAAGRPVLARARLDVERAAAAHALVRGEVWPDLMLGIQYGQRPGEMGVERMGSVMLGFSLPVFAARRQLRMRDEALAMEGMARAELDGLRVEVASRIAELLADLERDRSLIRLYRTELLPLADATVASALASYRAGAVDFMTVLDARMAVTRYTQELHALLAGYGMALAALEATIGSPLPVDGVPLLERTTPDGAAASGSRGEDA